MSELWDILAAAGKDMTAARYRKLGLTGRAIVDLHAQFPGYPAAAGCLPIEHTADNFWEPSEGGNPAVIVPATAGGNLLDLCAFYPGLPQRPFTRHGAAAAIGLDHIEAAALPLLGKAPILNIYADPLAWMRAGGAGAVLLDPLHRAPVILSGVRRILCHCETLARRLDRVMQRPPADCEIRIPIYGHNGGPNNAA